MAEHTGVPREDQIARHQAMVDMLHAAADVLERSPAAVPPFADLKDAIVEMEPVHLIGALDVILSMTQGMGFDADWLRDLAGVAEAEPGDAAATDPPAVHRIDVGDLVTEARDAVATTSAEAPGDDADEPARDTTPIDIDPNLAAAVARQLGLPPGTPDIER